jgi:hypothetical protein
MLTTEDGNMARREGIAWMGRTGGDGGIEQGPCKIIWTKQSYFRATRIRDGSRIYADVKERDEKEKRGGVSFLQLAKSWNQ